MKITKKKAATFYKYLLGHCKGMYEGSHALKTFCLTGGAICYELYIFNGVIVCEMILGSRCICKLHFDPETFERVNY